MANDRKPTCQRRSSKKPVPLLSLGHDMVLNNAALLKDLHDFPDYVTQLREIAKDDSRVYFCGTFPNQEISKVFSELDVLVVPSTWYENTPLVIYSAQAAGCPIVGSDVGGISEIIQHQIDGLLFERGNIAELAKSIRILYEDRTLLNKLAQRLSSPKSIEQYVDDLESTYNDLKNL